MNKNDVTARFEEEKLRVQEQSQLIYLQNQIDELRRLLKDQNNKYAWAMEQARRAEAQIAQIQNVVERQSQEILGTLETYKREIASVRRDISAVQVRLEEGIKPIREIQASVHQLSESRRQDRDVVTPWFSRIEELEHRARETVAQVRSTDERYRQLQSQLEQLRMADSVAVDEIRVLGEQIEIEKQALRRQAVEAQQLVSDVRASIEEPVARITHLEERYKLLDEQIAVWPDQMTAVEAQLPGIVEEVRRIELVSTERFLMNQERLEDLRHQTDGRLTDLHDTDEQYLRHLTGWLERIDAWCQEQEGRVLRITNRIELLHHRHEGRLTDLEAQEMQTLERIAGAWQGLLDSIKQGQVDRREPLADDGSRNR